MSPVWKGLIILSLVMNFALMMRVFVSGTAPTVSSEPAAQTQTPTSSPTTPSDPTLRHHEIPVAVATPPPLQVTDDNSSLARKIKGELFPEIQNSAAKNFPGLEAEKIDLTNGRFVVSMKTVINSRITRESARGLVMSVMRSYTEKHAELKGRSPIVIFPGDPPSMGQSL